MDPQPMCWQTVVLTVVSLFLTAFLVSQIVSTSGYSFNQEMTLIITIILGMGIIIAICTGAKWFLDAVISKLPFKTQDTAPKQ